MLEGRVGCTWGCDGNLEGEDGKREEEALEVHERKNVYKM